MYKLDITLNEPNDAETLELRVGDSPLLKVTVYDHDGTDWPDGYTATMEIGRSNRDPDIWTLTGTPGDDDNEWFFLLADICYTIGDYDMILKLTHPADADVETTPIYDTTPIEDQYDDELTYTFMAIPVEVR